MDSKKPTAPHSTKSSKKEKARESKKKRIAENGGVRPRKVTRNDVENGKGEKKTKNSETRNEERGRSHRFGKVMEDVPRPERVRDYTVSVAVAGSVVGNAQTNELSTYLIGQIGRAAAIYRVDEIVVFDDKLGGAASASSRRRRPGDHAGHGHGHGQMKTMETPFHVFMAKILQYMECPQYLRRSFFPMHPDYRSVGVLPPLDAPHHVRAYHKPLYREGVSRPDGSVDVGLSEPVSVDRSLKPNVRATVRIEDYDRREGIVVSPSTPRERYGLYWGYTTRVADSLSHVFSECPFSDHGYDYKIGTTERGHVSIDDPDFALLGNDTGEGDRRPSSFRHLIIVFGGVAGIEECVDADESLPVTAQNASTLFHLWLNTCPFQGSRTIRTEEAVLLSLARLHPFIINAQQHKKQQFVPKTDKTTPDTVQIKRNHLNDPCHIAFSDASPSEESSTSNQED